MRSGTTGSGAIAPRYSLTLVVPAALAGVAVAWALTAPDAVQAEAPVRALADGLGATVLGLAVLPRLHARIPPAWRLLAVFGGLWAATEFMLLSIEAAEVVGVRPTRLRTGDFGHYLAHISAGQIGIGVMIGTVAVTVYAALAHHQPDRATPDPVVVFAAVTLELRPITGHMSQQLLGSVLAAVHVLAASVWFGLLLAMALVLRGRGEWAAILPRYSRWALPAVAAVTGTGIVNGLVHIGDLAALLNTGYGRILLAKAVMVTALIALGRWWRGHWVPAAAAHRMPAASSLRRALIELIVMAVVFGLAAALSVTA
ncbi:MAG: CopD family protein [Nocardia sp.]|nr:CopD family protein [Nocardia sp.]